jgi:hypothetical protein
MTYSQHRCICGLRVLSAALLMAVAAVGLSPNSAVAQGTNAAPPADTSLGAHWVQKKIFFVYQGLQTYYSCEGLIDQMRKVLLQLGARNSDLELHETGCTLGFNQPTVSSGVAGTISVLEPIQLAHGSIANAAPGTVTANAAPMTAHWQPTQVHLDRPGRDANGQCELLQQVKLRVLPLFTTRNVQFQSVCSPRQLIVGNTILRLEVLAPDHRSDIARE